MDIQTLIVTAIFFIVVSVAYLIFYKINEKIESTGCSLVVSLFAFILFIYAAIKSFPCFWIIAIVFGLISVYHSWRFFKDIKEEKVLKEIKKEIKSWKKERLKRKLRRS